MEEIKSKIVKKLDILAFFKEEVSKIDIFSSEEKLIIINNYSKSLFRERNEIENVAEKVATSQHKPLDTSRSQQSRTFAELVRLTKTKQHPDIVMLAAYYLIISKQSESATSTDIEQQYSTAMLKPSTNTSAMINLNRKKGYLMEGEKKDGKMAFKITMSGVDYVENMIKEAE